MPSGKRKRAWGFTLAGAAIIWLTACSGNTTRTSTGYQSGPGGTVVQRLGGLWTTLDPQVQGVTGAVQIDAGLYDYLVALEGSKLVPYLATSWTATPMSVRFTLRRDATCSDGTPVTATVVANSFKRLLVTNAQVFGKAKDIFGPPPYTINGDDSTSTLTITIGRPFTGLLDAFSQASPNSAIVCPKGLANPSSLATTPAGSGPFTLASTVQGDSATLVARPDWHWGPDGISAKSAGFPQTVIYKVITNDTTAANELETGELNIAAVTGPDTARLIADHSLFHTMATPYNSVPIIFNQSPSRASADKAVRQALSTALDPKAFGQAMFGKYYTPSSSFLAPSAQCFDPATKALLPTPNVSKAKQIMLAAGYQPGSDGTWQEKGKQQPLTLTLIGSTTYNSGPDYLAAQFTAAGFAVKLNKTDLGTYAVAYLSGNFDVAITVASATTPDPNGQGSISFYSGPPPPTGSNATRVDYPMIDSEIAAANAATGAESCRHWAAVQEDMLKQYILVPTVAPQYQWFGNRVAFNAMPQIISPVFFKKLK